MYLPGHISVGYLTARTRLATRRTTTGDWGLYTCVIAGALFPDLVDKTILALDLSPYGRSVGHSLFGLLAILLVWAGQVGRSGRVAAPLAWFALGIASHLAADLFDDLVAGLVQTTYAQTSWMLWPFLTPDDWSLKIEASLYTCRTCPTLLEATAVAAALLIARRELQTS